MDTLQNADLDNDKSSMYIYFQINIQLCACQLSKLKLYLIFLHLIFFKNRFLNIFLDECKSVLTTKLQCANKKAEENRKLLQRLSKDLENIEKTRKRVHKIKGN